MTDRNLLPGQVRQRLLTTLESAPDVQDALLRPISLDSPLWDARPDPDRFTLREVLAHLADWEDIWLDRMTRTRDEDGPALSRFETDALAERNDYARSVPAESLARTRAARAALVGLLRSLSDGEWARVGYNDFLGPMTLEAQAVQIVCHDGYHTGQIAGLVGSPG